jgi:hypothetical protein
MRDAEARNNVKRELVQKKRDLIQKQNRPTTIKAKDACK